jgi:hypothetical protein
LLPVAAGKVLPKLRVGICDRFFQSRVEIYFGTGSLCDELRISPNNFPNEVVRQICRELNNAKDDGEKERELLSLLRAVIQDNHEEARSRMEFLKKKYPQVISDAKAAD